MARTVFMRAAARRDLEFTRMVGVSAGLHGTLLVGLLVVLPLVKPPPLPIVAYTVELTDSSALGGRLAPGKSDLPMGPRAGASAPSEAPAKQGEPVAKPEPPPKEAAPIEPEPPKPLERAKAPEPPKPEPPVVKLPSIEKPPPPKPAAKKPEPKPAPKPEPTKAEPAKAEPKPDAKPTDAAKAAEATPKPLSKPAEPKASAETKPTGKPTGKPDGEADGGDAYASAASKWRSKAATGGGGGLGGTDTSPGPMGTPGYGGGGGGQVVGFEFLAYQQRVVTTVKGVWTNAAPRPGLVAKVRFSIAPNGEVSGVRMEHASGNGVFDSSALRAVERANPLPPPPARYASEFRDFVIEFHSEEGGQGSG